MYAAFNAPPGVYARTRNTGDVEIWCHNLDCPDFNVRRESALMYEEDTGAHYLRDLECPTCGHDMEEEHATWTGQCHNARCDMYLEPQIVDDALALDEGDCADCGDRLSLYAPTTLEEAA